jgi:RHH-type proline utilization regulon transcriptional repressor/proline dehydrogenase/delta 1-pyrroline-5-carboxylate dehydrogenase
MQRAARRQLLFVPRCVPDLFSNFASRTHPRSELREAITAACRLPERTCVRGLMHDARLPVELKPKVADTARHLIETLRAKCQQSGVEGLMREYDLSSQGCVALMCLAEALLRIPHAPTREALIRDKIGEGDWSAHLGRDIA